MNDKNNKKLKIVIAGGGTGGHIYPALAIVQRLKKDEQVSKIYYLGCPDNMEAEVAEKEGVCFLPVRVAGMPRKFSLELINWFLSLNIAIITAMSYFVKIKPSIVIGTGGYVSGPALIAATLLGIPYIIHDPDAHPGIVSRVMAPWAKAVSIAFPQASHFLKSKNVLHNGNPIRESFEKTSKEEALKLYGFSSEKKTILICGGSQGAKKINDAMLNASKRLIKEKNCQIIHQTGRVNYDEYIKELKQIWADFEQEKALVIQPYFEDMAAPLSVADIVISRAGSLSISELNLCGLPSILVPYPFAAQDHQRFNARAMEKAGAALYLEDSECDSDKLFGIINGLISDESELEAMKNNNLKLSKPNATNTIVELIKTYATL